MDLNSTKKAPRRRDDRVILHFDLDCFYAQCVENRQPSLKTLPLGIKQKGILATCNYVARRHGVKKLMPIAEAKEICPDLVLADGEDLSPFRDVSKRLYALLRSYSWNGKIERLGLDEVFLDVTDIVSYNVELLNQNALRQSYFCLSRTDPEVGFEYDATSFAGCVHGEDGVPSHENVLYMRLLLASHLAQYLRLKIEEEGYTTACGISTNKLLAKLVGDRNKPRNQTTLLALREEDVLSFMDPHPLRKVPGIGFKTTSILEAFILNKEPDTEPYTMECSTTAGQVRTHPSISPPTLEQLLSGPSSEKGLGTKIWSLLHGVDDTEVKPARDVPTQISIEDTFKGLSHPDDIRRALLLITASLLRRMHIDLLDDAAPNIVSGSSASTHASTHIAGDRNKKKKWLAHPKTLRLSSRPYVPVSEHQYEHNDPSVWARTSRSCPLPSYALNITLPVEQVAERLVDETLLPLFWKINTPDPKGSVSQPGGPGNGAGTGAGSGTRTGNGSDADSKQKKGWGIGLINVCVTNMVGAGAGGRDIGEMFRGVERHGAGIGAGIGVGARGYGFDDGEGIVGGGNVEEPEGVGGGLEMEEHEDGDGGDAEGVKEGEEEEDDDTWDNDDADTPEEDLDRCPLCDRLVPTFAMLAHERYHSMVDA